MKTWGRGDGGPQIPQYALPSDGAKGWFARRDGPAAPPRNRLDRPVYLSAAALSPGTAGRYGGGR